MNQILTGKELVTQVAEYLSGMNAGYIVSDKELHELLGIKKPEKFSSVYEYDEYKLKWMSLTSMQSGVRDKLLKNHKMDWRRVNNGFVLLNPQGQVENALTEVDQKIKKHISKANKSLKYLQYGKLSLNERKRVSDTRAKLSQIAQLRRTLNN